MMLAAVFEVTWQGIAVVLGVLFMVGGGVNRWFKSAIGKRVGEAIFSPVLYELRTNDGGSLKDHVMQRFDSLEVRQDDADYDRAEIHRKLDAEIARVKQVEQAVIDREDNQS